MKSIKQSLWFLGLVLPLSGLVAAGATNSWTGAAGDWYDTTKWSLGTVPAAGDDIVITNTGASVVLSNSAPSLAWLSSLTLSRTLVFSNWNSILSATNITIKAGATATVANAFTDTQQSNNVYFACSNFVLEAGAVIDLNAKGYAAVQQGLGRAAGYGPSPGLARSGAGHGGSGGVSNGGSGPGAPCDSTNAPVQAGSSGALESVAGLGYSGAGGGAARIDASGAVLINGTIQTDAGTPYNYGGNSGGAGGSVYINCLTFSATTGVISADGGRDDGTGGGGGGGRIAIIYNAVAQTAIPKPSVQLSAKYGAGGGSGTHGTLFVTDTQVLPELGTRFNGDICNVSSWSPNSLTLSNSWIRFVASNFQLTITNNLILTNSATARLDLNNAVVDVRGGIALYGGGLYLWGNGTSVVSIVSSNDFLMTNGASFYIYAGLTNAAQTNYGGLVRAVGNFTIATNCTLYPYSHPTNGGSVFITASNFTLFGKINADAKGCAGRQQATGLGNGPGGFKGGGGYGGNGGYAPGGSCGNSNAPTLCGSSGGAQDSSSVASQNIGGAGGGLVWVQADDTIRVDGSITAAGGANGGYGGDGGGSGGGIYLKAKTIAGGGSLSANGSGSGNANPSGGGGGGRIAMVYASSISFNGATSAAGGAGNPAGNYGATGTVVQLLSGAAYQVTVHGDPVEPVGSCTYGVQAFPQGTIITNQVVTPAGAANGQRYACLGYVLSNAVSQIDSQVSTQVIITVTTNLYLSWRWTNQFYLTASANTNGGLQSPVKNWYTNGMVVSATAVASNGYIFLEWSGTGVPVGQQTNNPLVVTMDQPRIIQANFASLSPTNREWNGGDNWFSPTNWTPAGIPGPNDSIVIRSGTTVIGDPVTVQSLTVSNGSMLVFSNWQAKLTADSVFIRSNATLTLPAAFTDSQMSNQIWIVCANLTIDGGGNIIADAEGYTGVAGTGTRPSGYGLGAGGLRGGGGYGGQGGYGGGGTYGSSNAPVSPGSSGGPERLDPGAVGASGSGGGVIRADVSEILTVNGTISARGGDANGWSGNSGGAGGSIYLTCSRLVGTTGALQAPGGAGLGTGGGGGGGRIAVIMSRDLTGGTIVTNVAGGYGGYGFGAAGTVFWQVRAAAGSNYIVR